MTHPSHVNFNHHVQEQEERRQALFDPAAAEVASTFYGLPRPSQAEINWLRVQAGTVQALIDPDPILRAFVDVVAGHFEFAERPAGKSAFAILARDQWGDFADIVAWLPRSRHLACWLEGRKNYAELRPETVEVAKRLHRYPVNGRRRSLREVADALALQGHVTRTGKTYGAAAVAKMVRSKSPPETSER